MKFTSSLLTQQPLLGSFIVNFHALYSRTEDTPWTFTRSVLLNTLFNCYYLVSYVTLLRWRLSSRQRNGSGSWTRTSDVLVMGQVSYRLLHPASSTLGNGQTSGKSILRGSVYLPPCQRGLSDALAEGGIYYHEKKTSKNGGERLSLFRLQRWQLPLRRE